MSEVKKQNWKLGKQKAEIGGRKTDRLRRLRLRVNKRRMQEIFHYFRLHSFNLKAIAAGDSLEFFSARGSAHLHQPLLKLFNAIMGRLEFLLACYHSITSTMPRLGPPRLTCQYEMNSSTFSPINIAGRIQKTLAPKRA